MSEARAESQENPRAPRKSDALLAIIVDYLGDLITAIVKDSPRDLPEVKGNLTSALSYFMDTILLEDIKGSAPLVSYQFNIIRTTPDIPPMVVGSEVVSDVQAVEEAVEKLRVKYPNSLTQKYDFQLVEELGE